MKGRERFERTERCIIMEGFDGEYYIFNEENRRFVETDSVGAYALSLINGERRFKQIVDAVHERFRKMDVSYEEIFEKVKETFESAMRIGAIKKKIFPW